MKNNFQFLIYRSAEEDISVDAFIKDDMIWLTQKGMAKLFDCTTDNISFHLKISMQRENWMKRQLPRNPR